jgi:hypothetical protein
MPNDRHRADQAVTLPRKPPISICILNEAIVGTPSDAQHHGSQRRAGDALRKAAIDRPTLFAHWRLAGP